MAILLGEPMCGYVINGERATIQGRVIVGTERQLRAAEPTWRIVGVPSTLGRPMIAVDEWQRSLNKIWWDRGSRWISLELLAHRRQVG